MVDEADKMVEFRMDNLINFIRFSDNKIPIVIEIRNLVPLLDETFRSVMTFNGSFLSSSKSAEQPINRSDFRGPVHSKLEVFRLSNRRFIKGYTRL